MASSHKVKLTEQCRIYPAPSSATPPASLPLTFFDLVFWRLPPVQRLFFYETPALTMTQFLLSELPTLKQSLAVALCHFYPLAGSLPRTLDGRRKPELICSASDFVLLTVATSSDDFFDLAGNHPRHVSRFHPMVPPLASRDRDLHAVLAIQVTVFPDAGVAVGTTLHHAVADGSSYTHFMKTWAAVHRLGRPPPGPLPLFDRSIIRDPKCLSRIFINDLQALEGDRRLEAWDLSARPDLVRATFVFRQEQLERIGRLVEAKTSARCSPYALACGFTWAGVVRARGGGGGVGPVKTERFGFVTGCRARSDPAVPASYFGNCLGICCVEAEGGVLAGDDGLAAAAAAIWRAIEGLQEGAFGRAERWVRRVYEYAGAGAVTVAGSPKLGVYGVEFGWGRPRKVEVVSIERTGALSLAERRGEEGGGLEVGLALPDRQMEAFLAFYHGDGRPEN